MKGGGYRLEHLVPAGIHTLNDDSEIEEALEEIGRRTKGHTLRNWNEAVRKIGYKRFFMEVANSRRTLDSSSIGTFIEKLSHEREQDG